MLTHQGTQEILTARLRLRQYAFSDAEDMFRNYASDEDVTRFLTWTPYKSTEDVKTFLSGKIAEYEKPDAYHWAIELNGEMAGSISATVVDEKNCCCELGYCIGKHFWNRGYMSEAVSAVIHYFFEQVHMHRIMAKHDAENPSSGKVMQKCGMKLEGRLREHYRRHDGTYGDSFVYGILKREFAASCCK